MDLKTVRDSASIFREKASPMRKGQPSRARGTNPAVLFHSCLRVLKS